MAILIIYKRFFPISLVFSRIIIIDYNKIFMNINILTNSTGN